MTKIENPFKPPNISGFERREIGKINNSLPSDYKWN